jgi:hypothetical protein
MSDTNGSGQRQLAVFAVPETRDGEKRYWPKIGIAYTNRDGSISILLEALPLGTNKLQVREPRPPAERGSGSGAGARKPDFETVEVRQ